MHTRAHGVHIRVNACCTTTIKSVDTIVDAARNECVRYNGRNRAVLVDIGHRVARARKSKPQIFNNFQVGKVLAFYPSVRGGNGKMKTKLLGLLLLVGSTAFAGPRFFFGVGVGPAYVPAPAYVAPAPPPVAYVAPAPGPGYTWIPGYYVGAAWHAGYWARPPYPHAVWVGPRWYGGRYYVGHWRR